MTGKNIITINGRKYDAVTGLPVSQLHDSESPEPQVHHKPETHGKPAPHRAFADISGPAPHRNVTQPEQHHITHSEVKAVTVHQQLQKSQTLNRSAIKKPAPFKPQIPTPVPVRIEVDFAERKQPPKIEAAVQHHRSPIITKFAPSEHTPTIPAVHNETHAPQPAEQPRVHPLVAKVMADRQEAVQHQQSQPQSSQQLKEALIKERLAEAEPNTEKTKRHKKGSQPRLATILTSSLALLLLAGYLTYINLPNISMRVAATRAGIAANYPNYQPDGYHFAGPITYQPGQVNIAFQSNTNNNNFVIKQQASSWDSQAVLDNYVTKQTGNYLTYQEHGLTIYSFGNHAAWVNGGLLYTIDGDAPLNSDQLLNIATSM